MIQSLLGNVNTNLTGLYLFGGSTPGAPPVRAINGGYQYTARGSGLFTDLGLNDSIPITLGSGSAIGDVLCARPRAADPHAQPRSRRPALLPQCARGMGIAPGTINFQFNGMAVGTADLSSAQSTQDVINQLTAAIHSYETANGVTVLGPGGITTSGGSLSLDIPVGGSLTFTDLTGGTTAADLGLAQAALTPGNPLAAGLAPKLTLESHLTAIPGLTLPLDSIRIRFSQGPVTSFRDVSLSGAGPPWTSFATSSRLPYPGTRLQVNSAGTGIDLLSEIAGQTMSIEEVTGGVNTATMLGVRSMAATTAITDFNFGRGVRVVDGVQDPVSGLIDPTRNTDFRVTLGNGQAFDVDLRPQDLTDVQAILNRINAQFTTAIGLPPINASAPVLAAGDFNATLTTDSNGIAFVQTVVGGALQVSVLNNSAAAEDLGLLNGTYNGATSTLLAQDRAAVRVDNLFSDLIDLRTALLSNNSAGITLAAERLTASGDRLSQAHATVAQNAQRVEDASGQLTDLETLEAQFKSELQDLDFVEAASRFSQLQTQLQASLQTIGRMQSQTLLDFLS